MIRNCSQGTEYFRDQADLRMTNTLHQPACGNLRHPVNSYNNGDYRNVEDHGVSSYDDSFREAGG